MKRAFLKIPVENLAELLRLQSGLVATGVAYDFVTDSLLVRIEGSSLPDRNPGDMEMCLAYREVVREP